MNTEEVRRLHDYSALRLRLVNDLRLLSLADAGQLKVERHDIELVGLVRTVVANFETRAAPGGVHLEMDVPERFEINADPDRVAQVITNLLENAVRHTPEGGVVTALLEASPLEARLSVLDTGPGLSPDALERVFERFYRDDPSRDRSSGGSGLGLAIVRALVEAHGGHVEAANRDGGGANFTVTMPHGSGA